MIRITKSDSEIQSKQMLLEIWCRQICSILDCLYLQFAKKKKTTHNVHESPESKCNKMSYTCVSKPMANILIDKRLRSFPLRSETREVGLLMPLLFNVVLKVPARTCRQKKNKSHPNWIARGGGRGVRGVNVYRWHLSFVR